MNKHRLVSAFRIAVAPAAAAIAVACAAPAPPPAAPPPPASSASGVSAKHLTESACESLAQWIVAACEANDSRVARTEGWCSDVEDRSQPDDHGWIRDCTQHVTEIDEACFRSTTSVPNLMDCDAAVSR